MPASNRQTHILLPSEVTGYAFDPAHSWWSSIVAEGSTNLVINPSFELLNDDEFVDEYDAAGTWEEVGEENIIITYPPVGAVAGRRAARLVGAIGSGTFTYTELINVTPGVYTFSIDIYVDDPAARVMLAIMNVAAVVASTTHLISDRGWQRIHLTYTEAATSTRTLRLSYTNPGPHTVTMYTDTWQFERKPYPTTYLDGDMLGFNDTKPYSTYYWHGAPHASISTRIANTGSGGRLVAWSDVSGFRTTSIVGLLMAPVEQRVQVLGNGKSVHRDVGTLSRDFTITGRIFGGNYEQTLDRHNALQHLLRPNNTASDDQMILRYQQVNDDKQLVGLPMEIICVYNDGLQGGISNFYQMALAVQFTAVMPYLNDIYESTVGLALVKELVSNMIVYRDEHGEFFNLGTGTTEGGVITRVGFLRDGRIVAFGNFTQIAGTVADFGAIWDGAAWAEIPGTDGSIIDIDDGFKLGYPLTVSTAGGQVHVYDPDTDTWEVLGGGDWLGPIYSIARDENGDVWIGGAFETSETGFTTYNNVARWNAATEMWETLGDGLTDPGDLQTNPLRVNSVLVPNDGYVYFAGTFSAGVSGATNTLGQNNVIKWSIADEVYEGMGSGFNEAPNQLIQGQDGYIYAVGPFSMNGTSAYDLRGFARWNGYSWEEVFPLVRPGDVYGAEGVVQDSEGIFWFYNNISDPEDDLFVVEGLGNVPFFGWRNGVFYPPYMADGCIRYFALGPGDRAVHAVDAYVGAGTPTKVPAMTRIAYEGSANTPVVVHLQGVGQFNRALNLSTEGGIYGRNNFIMSAHESVVLRNDLQRILYYSNQRHSLYNRLLIGASNMAALRLIPGENRISLFVIDSDEDSQGWLAWKNRYWAIGDNG